MSAINLLFFANDSKAAARLTHLTGLVSGLIERHNFPDGEFKLRLPSTLAQQVVILHTLDHPNDKLMEILFAAKTAKAMGVKKLILIAPYLAYMRQDIAFSPGEVVSQKIIGELLSSLFDVVITIDPHLHRIATLGEVIRGAQTQVLSAAPILGDFVVSQRDDPFLVGPDDESSQWISQAAARHQLDYAVAQKIRHGDLDVEIVFPNLNVQGRAVVLLDDIASSGRTLVQAATYLLAAGAKTVDVAVTHALFNGDALDLIKACGVQNIWSTDTVNHETNAISVMPLIATALNNINKDF